MNKDMRYRLEFITLFGLMKLFTVLGANNASRLGGFIGRTIGPKIGASRTAIKNIRRAFPDWSEEEVMQTVCDMWDNLGRIVAEYPHIHHLLSYNTTFKNLETLRPYIEGNKPFILCGGHIGNWEIGACFIAHQFNAPTNNTYRAANNPYVDRMLMKYREITSGIAMIPKSKRGGTAIIKALKTNQNIGVLLDQKYNEGIPVSFFGTPAMTNAAFVKMAQKFDCPMIPARCKRLADNTFEIEVFSPLSLYNNDKTPRSEHDVMVDLHTHMEDWITDAPAQWLWLHKRWKPKN